MVSLITPPSYPMYDIGLDLTVTKGVNQIQQTQNRYRVLYPAENNRIAQEYMEIAPGGIYRSSSTETIDTLVVSTSVPVAVTYTTFDDDFVTVTVNRLFVLDSSIKYFSIQNGGSTTARININVRSKNSEIVAQYMYYGVSVPPPVYNNAFVHTLEPVQGDKNREFTVNCGEGQKIYYAYPASYGFSVFTVNGFTGGFSIKATIPVQTQDGPINYNVYESDNSGLGATVVTVSDS